MSTCKLNREQSRERVDAINGELAEITADLEVLVHSNKGKQFDTLSDRADALIEERRAIHKAHPGLFRMTGGGGGPMGNRTSRSGDDHYRALHKLQGEKLDDGGFSSLGEFLSVLNSGRYDPRIQSLQFQASSGAGNFGTGGVLVPEAFLASDLHPPTEAEIVLPRAQTYPMDGAALHVSGFDGLSASGGTLFGGFSAEWVAENDEFTDQTPKTIRITLERKKLGLFTTASNELVSDSQFESQLVPKLREAIGYFRDGAYLTGNGTGKPKGVLSDAALIVVNKETGQAADTIVYQNLTKMFSRIHPAHINRSTWIVSPTCLPQLLELTIPAGTGGEHVPVLQQGAELRMLTRPVLVTSKLPVLGDQGDILLADLSQYAVGMSRGLLIDRSEHAKFQRDQTVWRAVFRSDGQGTWNRPFQPENGPTQSWCVTLAERS